jgi:radical SAM superfamily enzyme YgiQ (UPF0313 family)
LVFPVNRSFDAEARLTGKRENLTMPRALLVYPEFPPSYWSFRYALELLGKRASMPPLGLLTVAALFPESWELRLADLNLRPLADSDLEWADLVLTSTMVVQQRSLREVIARCNAMSRPVVVGGPYPTSFAAEITGADHYVLGEVEESFPRFLAGWEAGHAAREYRPNAKPAMTVTPVPRFDLLDLSAYGSMALQFSRGCPFDCEFCDITKLFGRVPRTKSNDQMVAELDALDAQGWRGALFLVDDNFIGNKKEALRLLPAVTKWQREHGYPFDLYTEASVNLARNEALMDAMVDAGFSMVFLGIESPNPDALRKTNKIQNTVRDDDDYLFHAVRTIQKKGMEVTGGFIIGLDGDGPGVFQAQVDFIQRAGIPLAMVGLLTALKGTDLYARMEREGRLLADSSGNNVEITLNFVPELDREVLIDGYRSVLANLYGPDLRAYFARCKTLLSRLRRQARPYRKPSRAEVLAFLRSLRLQLFSRQGPAYASFLAHTLATRPSRFAEAMRMAIKGWHFQRFTTQMLATHAYREAALGGYERVEGLLDRAVAAHGRLRRRVERQVIKVIRRVRRRYRRLRPEFRQGLLPDRATIESALRELVREVAACELIRRWVPQLHSGISDETWRQAIEAERYEVLDEPAARATLPRVALAPLVAQGRLRRSLEHFLRELGLRVVTTGEQLAQLGQERLERIHAGGETPERVKRYLYAVAQRIDTLVVPFASSLGSLGGQAQLLAVRAAQSAAKLPRLVCVRLDGNRRETRARLIELGIALTGDRARAEAACERALALVS